MTAQSEAEALRLERAVTGAELPTSYSSSGESRQGTIPGCQRYKSGLQPPCDGPRGTNVKSEGPVPEAVSALRSGPSGMRAIQDSNLWPSAPEADALSI
jgi:hypothetical protein